MYWKEVFVGVSIGVLGLGSLAAQENTDPPTPVSKSHPPHTNLAAAQQVFSSLAGQYCVECHGPDVQEAGLRFDTIHWLQAPGASAHIETVQPAEIQSLGEFLERVLAAGKDGSMPPESALPLSVSERAELVAALDNYLRGSLGQLRRPDGTVGNPRRLTNEEYNRTMQSLFGVNARFHDWLPPDPISTTGYRNDRALLGLSSIRLESYLDSARRAVDRYVQFDDERPGSLKYHIEFEDLYYSSDKRYKTRARAPQPVSESQFLELQQANRRGSPEYVDFLGPWQPGAYSDDELWRAAIPKLNQQYIAIPERFQTGLLTVRIRAAAKPSHDGRFPRMRIEAGHTMGDGCSIDKRMIGESEVRAPLDAPGIFEFHYRLEDLPSKGVIRDEDSFDQLSLFDMDQFFISNVTLDPQAVFGLGRGAYATPEEGSRKTAESLETMSEKGLCQLYLDCIEIEMREDRDDTGLRWQFASPSSAEGASRPEVENSLVRKLLARFLPEAYRRPIGQHELEAKLSLFQSLRSQETPFRESVKQTLVATLISPSFLFLDSRPANTGNATVVSHSQSPANGHSHDDSRKTRDLQFTLASKLSYLLWQSPPDERLLELAEQGKLSDRALMRSEVNRLMDDPQIQNFLDSFCTQWLRLDKLPNVVVSREHYPQYDPLVAEACHQETLQYFAFVFRDNRNALDLIDSQYAVLNDTLAQHYAISGITNGQYAKHDLPPGSNRGGLLTQASLLTMNSNGVDSHPIRRGVWLLDRILNRPPPPPPPEVPEIDPAAPQFQGLSLKQQLALHRSPGSCSVCHERIDPWGLVFEQFDASGRDRMTPDDDATTQEPWQLPDGTLIEDIRELKRHLRDLYADAVARSLTHHMLTYALGRKLDYLDRAVVDDITAHFVQSNYSMRELILAIVTNPTFHAAR